MTPRMIPATAVPLKGWPFFEIMAKQTAPTPQMIATGKAKQQSVKRAKIPLIREIVAKEFFSRLGRCGWFCQQGGCPLLY